MHDDFFGDPKRMEKRQDARDCLEMALSMQEKNKFLQVNGRMKGY